MAEYWWSARRAALRLRPGQTLPEQAPPAFRQLRPLIHHGWEMVLAALELSRPDLDLQSYLQRYDSHLKAALSRWQLEAKPLQAALEAVRHQALVDDPEAWLGLHQPYPGVPERLRRLEQDGHPWLVLTTKGGAFAEQLLAASDLHPVAIYGHEQGSKPEVLLRLQHQQTRPLWFVEDRRPTLETVRSTPGLEAIRCFLVEWGYLAPGDTTDLPAGIHLLPQSAFCGPLADWP